MKIELNKDNYQIVWTETVGQLLSENSKAVKFENGVLMVVVENAVWRLELNKKKKEILDKINSGILNPVEKILFI
jgi:predicted nucleic acid-binding Zn ribbon protein